MIVANSDNFWSFHTNLTKKLYDFWNDFWNIYKNSVNLVAFFHHNSFSLWHYRAWSVRHISFLVFLFLFFDLTAPALMVYWPQIGPLPTRITPIASRDFAESLFYAPSQKKKSQDHVKILGFYRPSYQK